MGIVGSDLTDPIVSKVPFFAPKIEVRKWLEERCSKDSSLGYTYVMNGIISNFMIQRNVLGLSEDKKTAKFLGDPNALLTATHTDEYV